MAGERESTFYRRAKKETVDYGAIKLFDTIQSLDGTENTGRGGADSNAAEPEALRPGAATPTVSESVPATAALALGLADDAPCGGSSSGECSCFAKACAASAERVSR